MADVNVELNPGTGGAKLRMKPGPSASDIPYTMLDGGADGQVDPIRGDGTNGLDVDVTRNGKPATGAGGGPRLIDEAAVTPTNVLASNAARLRAEVQHIGSAPVYLAFGTTADFSAGTYHKKLMPGDEWVTEGPHVFTGAISADTEATADQLLVVAEFT